MVIGIKLLRWLDVEHKKMPNDPYVSLGRYFIRKKNISEGVAGTLQGGITGGAANRRLAQQLLHKKLMLRHDRKR